MKTVIYARKSTMKDGQKDTIQNQIKICQRRAKELGLTVVDIKKDSSSGTTDNNRDEVKELISGAIKGEYECVIMKGISRFYRDVEHGLGLIKKLDRSNIRVITVEENFDSFKNRTGNGQLDTSMIALYLVFAENESKKIAERIKYTQIEKAHAGEWNQSGSVPFGYDYDSTTKKLKINFSNSEIVKMIFDLYLSGMGMKSIAFYLNGDNEDNIVYPSPRGNLWSQYTVGFMLKNRVYVGDVVYNKRSKTARPYKQPESIGKTDDDVYIGNDYNDVKDWIITKDAHEPIVSREVFEIVQNMIKEKGVRGGIKNNISLLASVSKCGKCGAGMTLKRGRVNKEGIKKTKDNYYCSHYIKYGKKICDSHHVGAKDFEEFVINQLKSKIKERLDESKILTNIKQPNKKVGDRVSNIKKIELEIQSISKKTDVLLEKNISQVISDAQFSRMNDMYLKEMDVLINQLEKLKEKELSSKEIKKNENHLKNLYDKVINIESFSKERQRYIILDLIEKITVTDGVIDFDYKFK